MHNRRINRRNQRSWDALSLLILIVALVVVAAILMHAALRSTAKGEESGEPRAESRELTESGERRGESSSPLSALRPPQKFALHLPCVITQIVDGDTVTVEITLQARVRLEDCWAPETTGGTETTKAAGLASKQHLSQIAEGKRGGLLVVLDGAKRLDDVFSFGRIVGRVWCEDAGDLARKQVLSGHAFATKDELVKALAERRERRGESEERRAESTEQ